MKRNNILAKKRLMKTTTYITALLVAVTMILSGTATVATVNENVNVSIEGFTPPTAPASAGDIDADTLPDPEPLVLITEKPFSITNSNRGLVVWDNHMTTINNWWTSDDAFPVLSADDFVFTDDTTVGDVHWIAGYYGADGPTDWCVEFYADDGTGNAPGALIEGPFCYDAADINHVAVATPWPGLIWAYECSVDTPALIDFTGGVKYWVCIYGTNAGSNPQTGVCGHKAPNPLFGAPAHSWEWFGPGVWYSTVAIFGYQVDMNYQLTAKPAHDVYADAILAPTALSAFCPCTPVEATFKNAGVNDETDVPVSVEIRRYVLQDDFTATYGTFWDPIYLGNMWFQVAGETAYPFVVNPRSPPFMIELDSGLTGPGQAYLDSLAIDLTGLCHPMMNFYMWHDTYSSDDFIDVYANDGSGWIKVGGPYERLCCPGCTVGWQEHVIDLSAFSGAIWIRFEGNCDSNPGAYNLQIDDFSIYDQEYYEEDEVDIDVGQTVTVEFPEWCPCNWQDPAWANKFFDIEVVACTDLDTDEIPTNDCVHEVVAMYMPFEHDVAAISIDEPVENVGPVGTFEMCGTIKNVGQYEECCFTTYMTVEEQYTIPGTPPSTLYSEDFSSWPAPGWTSTGGWGKGTGSYAGGTAPEAKLSWYLASSGDFLMSPPVNTIGPSGLELEFKSYLDVYYTYSIDCYVEVTDGIGPFVDITPWPNPVPANQGPDTYTIDISAYIGSGTQVKFTFVGSAWDLDYWYIDDVKFNDPGIPDSYGYYSPEYEDSYCIDDIQVCEEIPICFDDWTPATPWPDCGEKTYRICLETNMCDPMDENPLNDKTCEFITVEFWHDVAITEITSPDNTAPWDIQFEFDVAGASGASGNTGVEWDGNYFYSCRWASSLMHQYSSTGVKLKEFSIAGVGNSRDFAYNDGNGYMYSGAAATSLREFDVISETLISSYSMPVKIRALAYDSDEDAFWCNNWGNDITLVDTSGTILYTIPNTISLYSLAFDNRCDGPTLWLFSGTSGGGGCQVEQYIDIYTGGTLGPESHTVGAPGALIAGGLGFTDSFFAGETSLMVLGQGDGGLPDTIRCYEICETGPGADAWLTCGEQDFCATFENLGTFDEPGCIIDWDLYDNTDPLSPVYITGDSDTIDLDVGEVLEDYCFGSYDFTEPGYYLLVVEIIAPTVDCYLNNNIIELEIGVDCCAPESCADLSPIEPDGENNWYISKVTVHLYAWDTCEIQSGIKEIVYILNGVENSIPGDDGTFSIEEDGVHHVIYYAVDNVGHEEAIHHSFEVAIDQGDPSVDLIYEAYEEDDGWYVDFSALASDSTSGMDKVEFYIDGSLELTDTEAPYTWTIAWEDGYEDKTFKATAYDNAGNSASDTVDGSIIEAVPYFHSQPAVPVWLVQPVQQLQQQQTNPLVKL